jgi:predicted alpha/beta superfamily hydrolase
MTSNGKRRPLGPTLLAAAALLSSTTASWAADWTEVDAAAAVLPGGLHVRDAQSSRVGGTLRIFIGSPVTPAAPGNESYDSPAATHPVIYVLDANGMFLDVLSMARMLVKTRDVPPAVVVGVGYPVEAFEHTMNLRSRDYTPSPDPGLVAVANRTMWPGLPDAETATSGGADAFLDFVQSELMPMIEEEFGGDPDDATIVGHSFGGLLASYALVSRPGLFQRHVISSPSLWWDDGYLLALERKLAADREDLPARAFFSIGAFEDEDIQRHQVEDLPPEQVEGMREFMDHIGRAFMVRRAVILENTLVMRGYPNLDTELRVFESENHNSVRYVAFSRGLRFVFGE